MTNFVEKFIAAASDSHLTASFQSICGIRKHNESNSHGLNGDSHRNNAGSLSSNGSAVSNGYESSTGIVSNGHVGLGLDHTCNGIKSNLNGLKERHHIQGKNGFKTHAQTNGLINGYKNGYVNGNGLTNGHIHHSHSKSENGQSQSNGNGHIKSESADALHSEYTPKYTIENYFLYYIFSFGASLGNEIFYIMFFTFSIWNFDAFVVRKVLIVWCVIMYIGQAAKDVIRWPRPLAPPVIRLEQRYELEYGMPSTHAMVGIAIPFGLIVFMSGRYEVNYDFNFFFGLLFAITWSVLVSVSRLYLGMHSVLDIMAGIFFAFFLMAATMPFVDTIDKFLISHPLAVPVMVAVCIGLCLIYPTQDKWNSARGDTTLVLAVFSGIFAGLWFTGALTDFEPPKDSPPFVLEFPSMHEIGMKILRQVIGVAILVVIIEIMKKIVLRICAYIAGYDYKDYKIKKLLPIELPYRYISYSISSAAACYIMPLIFLKLNIERQSFYSEVFNY